MQAKLARWGNSLAVRLPAEVVRDLGLTEGQLVQLERKDRGIEIRPSATERRYVGGIPVYTLEELVAQMRPGKEPELVDWGPDVGSENIDDGYSRGEITLETIVSRPPAESR